MTPRAEVLAAIAHLWSAQADTAVLTRALERFADSGEEGAVGTAWWSAFDERTRCLYGWPAARRELPDFWQWALSVCAGDGRVREAALAPGAVPLAAGRRGVAALLAVRCADWVEPIRAAARAAFAQMVAAADDAGLAWAAASAWACEGRERGAEAVEIVAVRLADASPTVWDHLFAFPDHRVRRRALAQAAAAGRLDAARLSALAVGDSDPLVAQHAAETLLALAVPAGEDSRLDAPGVELVGRLLGARLPTVRAAVVTVLRRAQRPDLARPFTADRSASVRQVARWVLRSCGEDPAGFCRALLARPAREITPGAVSGLAECGESDDAAGYAADTALLRAQATHPRSKVRAAALHALGTRKPSAVTPEVLAAVLDEDPAPSVLRTAARLLEPDAAMLTRDRLDGWLAPGRPSTLRRHAARLARAAGGWNRLEANLRLLHDPDPVIARDARRSTLVCAYSATASYRPLADGRRDVLTALLEQAGEALDARTVDRLRFGLTVRS